MPDFVKTSLKIREDLFLKGKLLAEVRGTTFSEIFNTALEEYLKKHENEIKEKISYILK